MKLTFATVILSLFAVSIAHGDVKCKLRAYDVESPIVGSGTKKADALANAIEKCVDKRTEKFERLRGPVDEERYAALIDSCTQLSCEK
jgi:hypothetical protein